MFSYFFSKSKKPNPIKEIRFLNYIYGIKITFLIYFLNNVFCIFEFLLFFVWDCFLIQLSAKDVHVCHDVMQSLQDAAVVQVILSSRVFGI